MFTRKSSLVLTALSALFLAGMASLHSRNRALERELADNRRQCEQRVERLRRDFQAETEDLQQYLRTRYNFRAPGATASSGQPAAEAGPAQPSAGEPALDRPAVERKYRFMSHMSDRESVREMLYQLLLEREQLAADGEFGEQMGTVEGQIGELLGVTGYQEYQMLKDSDPEQHHLREYAASVSEFAPINPEQERSLLWTKLQHKQTFRRMLLDSGFYQQQMSEKARGYLQNAVRRGLEEYKNSYLKEVKPLLSSEQFSRLQKYEATEFNWELERLLKQINTKTAAAP